MSKRVRLPRLTLQDMKDLRRAFANLVAAKNTLDRSGWASAPAVTELVTGAAMVIGPLHDRAEPAYLQILAELGTGTLQERGEAARLADHSEPEPAADQAGPEDE